MLLSKLSSLPLPLAELAAPEPEKGSGVESIEDAGITSPGFI